MTAEEELALVKRQLRAAQEGERAALEEARAAKAHSLSLAERLHSMGLGAGGGDGTRRCDEHCGTPLPATCQTTLPSPTSQQAKCFLAGALTGFLCAPVTLPHDPAVAAAFACPPGARGRGHALAHAGRELLHQR